MVIHSARPQAAGTTQNNPLKTNGPKNPDPSSALEIGHGRNGEHIHRGVEGLSGRETRGHRPAREGVEQESGCDERDGLMVARNDDGTVLVMGARWLERTHTHFDEVGKRCAQTQGEPDKKQL